MKYCFEDKTVEADGDNDMESIPVSANDVSSSQLADIFSCVQEAKALEALTNADADVNCDTGCDFISAEFSTP